MKSFKNFCKSNRVFVVLMALVLICIVIVGICMFSYFYGGKDSGVYGNRLEGIEDVEISSSRKSEIESELITDEQIKTAKLIVTGKIVYITMEFVPEISLVEAEGKASVVLDKFSEEEKAFYDFQFTLKQESSEDEEGFKIAGAKNANGTNIVWTNNTKTDDDTEESSK